METPTLTAVMVTFVAMVPVAGLLRGFGEMTPEMVQEQRASLRPQTFAEGDNTCLIIQRARQLDHRVLVDCWIVRKAAAVIGSASGIRDLRLER